MISIDLARRLRDRGMAWRPADGDRFFIPDRDLDDQTFSISDMVVTVRTVSHGRQIAFNGAVEWALDAIMQREVVWLPSETQLRRMLGDRFVSLERSDGAYRCVARIGSTTSGFVADSASDAYGLAVLAGIEHGA